MSKTGTVKSFNGKFGFVDLADGTVAYVHTEEIDGGRLRVGHKVSLDTEAVEGHDGRVKGVNVSGKGVMAKGEKLSDEDFEADKKMRETIKEEFKAEQDKAYEPVKEKVDTLSKGAKLRLVRELTKELGLQAPVSQEAAKKAAKQAAKVANERRKDPTAPGGPTFTKAEFAQFYGAREGARMWEVAGALSKTGAKGGKAKKSKKVCTVSVIKQPTITAHHTVIWQQYRTLRE